MANAQRVIKQFQTGAFRLSYPALLEAVDARLNKVGIPTAKDLKFGCTMLFPKSATVAKLKAEKHPAAQFMSDDNCAGLYQTICQVARGNFGPEVDLTSLRLAKLRDGDKPRPQKGTIDENAVGYIWARATSKEKPTLLRQDKTVITDATELYAGCWVRAVLTVAPFTAPEHGVTLYLAGIQKLADDQRFSSRVRCEDEFDAVASEGTFMGTSPAAPAAHAVAKNPWEV